MKNNKNIIIIISLLILSLLCTVLFIKQDTISYKIGIFRMEQEYKKTSDDSSLINLVLALQKDGYFDKAITYSRELIDVITEDGIKKSELSYTSYVELLESNSAKDIAIVLYLFTIMNAKEYELFTKEFVEFYPQTSLDIRYTIDIIPTDAYERTLDNHAINAAVNGYLQLAKTTDNNLLKEQCKVKAKKLTAENTRPETQGDGSSSKTGDGSLS